MALRAASAFALSLGLLCAGRVAAQTGSAVDTRATVVVENLCAVVPSGELQKLIALELAPRTVATGVPLDTRTARTRAKIECHAQQADLSATDVTRDRRQALTLDLSQTAPDARARLLALTLSELVASLELDAAPGAVREPTRIVAAPVRTVRTRVAPASRVWLGVGLAREGKPAMLMPSAQTGLLLGRARSPLALQGELQVHRGRRAVEAGDVVAWTTSGSLGVAGRWERAWAALTLGVGMRLGYARLRGEADSGANVAGRTVSGLWWGPVASASAVLPTRSRLGLRCGVDLGYVAREVRGHDGTGAASFALGGLQLHLNLGVSLKLGARGACPTHGCA